MILNFSNAALSDSVLIIDDELSILNLLKLTLSRKGFIVDTAQSGEEGIKKIDSNEYGLVLTDIQMPGLSGNQILDYIKDYKKSKMPVIGMSGTPWLLNQEKFDAILPKPSSMKNIWTVVDQIVTKA